MVDEASGSGAELRQAGKKAHDQMQITLKPVCMVYKVLCRRLLEAVQQSCKVSSKRVTAVIGDCQYSICGIALFSNLEHNLLSIQDMSNTVELLSALTDLIAHGHIICFAL